MANCTNCTHLQAEVDRLQTENYKLRIKVRKLEIEVDRLLRLIYSVAQYCYSIAQDAVAKMKNLPLGVWAYLKGQYQVASVVYNALRGE